MHVGSRVYVGEHSIVALGALVGQDAVIMPLSIVPRFHNCKPGSVWTGSPGRELNADECKGSTLLHTLAEHKQNAAAVRGQGPENELWPDLLVTLCLLCLDTFYTAANLMPALLLYLLYPPFATAVQDSDVRVLARFLPVVVYGELLCVVLLLAFIKRQCVARPVRIAPVASLNYLRHRLGARCLKLLFGGLTRGFVESVFIQPLLRHGFGIDIRHGAEVDTCHLGAPDCVVVGEGAMINGGAMVGEPIVLGGRITLQTTVLGRRCFLGSAPNQDSTPQL